MFVPRIDERSPARTRSNGPCIMRHPSSCLENGLVDSVSGTIVE
jgi:hypothetical protein